MQHIHVLYFLLTFSLGMMSPGIAMFAYFKTREKLLRYYLDLYTTFTAVIVSRAPTLGYSRYSTFRDILFIVQKSS